MLQQRWKPQEGWWGAQPNNPESGKDGMNVAQQINAETKKAVCSDLKNAYHGGKHCSYHKESDSDSDYNY